MDVEKLLGVFEELIAEEEEYNVQSILKNILNSVNTDNAEQIDSFLQELKEYSESSIVNHYAISKIKILNKVGGSNLFGIHLYELINNIVSTQGYKIKNSLSTEITTRNNLIAIIKENISNLEKLDFESYYDSLEEYELGLIIPQNEAELEKVEKYLKDVRQILRTINELSNGEYEEPKIYSVSSNSVGIFLLSTFGTTLCILKIFDKILDIYKKVYEIKKLKIEYKRLLDKEPKEIDKEIKETIANEKEKIVEEIVKEYGKNNLDQGRQNELKIGIRSAIDKVIEMQDKGIVIEATAPKYKEEPEENDDEKLKVISKKSGTKDKSNLEKAKEVAETFSNVSKSINEIKLFGKEILQLSQYNEKEEFEEGKEE